FDIDLNDTPLSRASPLPHWFLCSAMPPGGIPLPRLAKRELHPASPYLKDTSPHLAGFAVAAVEPQAAHTL
ncbi:MAG TPA: hypothetical protein VN214_08465, partial [Pseudomonas sp.]|nr:hypothetical protein [Pseudomonas sp.]